MKEEPYSIRAHHGMCLAFFKGKGYSSEFVTHMSKVKEQLQENPLVRVIGQTDIICKACPNNEHGVCTSAGKVAEYDRQVFLRCGLSEGDILPYFDFQRLVNQKILLPGKREEICGDCQWNGLCK